MMVTATWTWAHTTWKMEQSISSITRKNSIENISTQLVHTNFVAFKLLNCFAQFICRVVRKIHQPTLQKSFLRLDRKRESLLNQEMKKNIMKLSRLFKAMNHSHLLHLLTLSLAHKTVAKSSVSEVG